MKTNFTKLGLIPFFIPLAFALSDCKKEEIEKDFIVVDVKEETDWDYWVGCKDGNYFFLQEINSKPSVLIMHSDESGKEIPIFFNNGGFPEKVIIDNYIFLFQNYVGNKVDIAVILPTGEIQIARNISCEIDWDQVLLKRGKSIIDKSDLFRWTGRVVGAVPCAISVFATVVSSGAALPLAVFECGNYLLELTGDIMENELDITNGFTNAIDTWGYAATITECSGGSIGCFTSLASEYLSYKADQLELLNQNGSKINEAISILDNGISVTTDQVEQFSSLTATVGGVVSTDGSVTVTDRGVYFSSITNPRISGSKLQIGSGSGTFSTELTGLAPNTTYFVEAYAKNNLGSISYGSQVSFTTLNTSGTSTLLTDLVSYWGIDETSGTVVHDSHSSNDCTVQSGVTINQNGLSNRGASFISTSKGLTTGKTASQLGIGGGNSKSVSIWIKPDPNINGLNSCGIINVGSEANQKQFGIKYYGAPAFWMFDSWYGSVRIGTNDNKLADGNWHHIVVTYNSDGHKLRTYLDGAFVTEDVTRTLNTGDGMTFSIGIGSQGKYIGMIDEVGLWKRPLSDSEVQSLYNNGLGESYPF